MISKFQFDTICQLLNEGITNYVQLRQHVGLTSDELYEILNNFDYYSRHFEEQDRLAKIKAENSAKKKHWWRK